MLTDSDNGSALYPELLDAISRAYAWPRDDDGSFLGQRMPERTWSIRANLRAIRPSTGV